MKNRIVKEGVFVEIEYVLSEINENGEQGEVLEECPEESAFGFYMGAGEILLNSVDRDGLGNGYDLKLLNLIANHVKIPVIACGGVGEWYHFQEALENTNVDAVAAANIFHYRDQSVYLAKKHLYETNMQVRKPDLLSIN